MLIMDTRAQTFPWVTLLSSLQRRRKRSARSRSARRNGGSMSYDTSITTSGSSSPLTRPQKRRKTPRRRSKPRPRRSSSSGRAVWSVGSIQRRERSRMGHSQSDLLYPHFSDFTDIHRVASSPSANSSSCSSIPHPSKQSYLLYVRTPLPHGMRRDTRFGVTSFTKTPQCILHWIHCPTFSSCGFPASRSSVGPLTRRT